MSFDKVNSLQQSNDALLKLKYLTLKEQVKTSYGESLKLVHEKLNNAKFFDKVDTFKQECYDKANEILMSNFRQNLQLKFNRFSNIVVIIIGVGVAGYCLACGVYVTYKIYKWTKNRLISPSEVCTRNADNVMALDEDESHIRNRLIRNNLNQNIKLKEESLSPERQQEHAYERNYLKLAKSIKFKLRQFPPLLYRSFYVSENAVQSKATFNLQFRVMQWNVLAKSFCTETDFPKSPKQALDWSSYRLWRILEELLVQNSDIICLQEVDFYEEIKPFLHDLGYSSVFCPKYSSTFTTRNSSEPNGCVVFFRLDKFQLNRLHCENIYLDGKNQAHVFIIVGLRHLKSKKHVTVVCVHLKAHGEFSKQRKRQAEIIVDTLKKHLCDDVNFAELKNYPVILCGDFNGEDTEDFYRVVIDDPDIKLADAYMTKRSRSPSPPKTSNGNGKPSSRYSHRCIDYIFYASAQLRQVSYIDVLASAASKRHDLPNMLYPSDHLSLVCDFQFI